MWLRRRLLYPLLRFALRLLYNQFAFAYDFVSAIVSRGQWHAWTRTAIPFIVGKRVLEIPCGTGNLLLDLNRAGYQSVGVDLSPFMLDITRRKSKAGGIAPRLMRARVEALPFPSGCFDTVIMTFPPGFPYNPRALAELRRMLAACGRLIWVDAGRLLTRDIWSRLLNYGLDLDGGETDFDSAALQLLGQAGYAVQVHWVKVERGIVAVVTATVGGVG